jgi:hypothetical protein
MKDCTQKHYLCTSGEVKRHAEEHRHTFIRLREQLWKVVKSFGSDEASICDTMMLIRGIKFKGAPPEGWTKPNRYEGSRPKRGTLPPETMKFFTPGGSYFIETHPELKALNEWLKCPFSYSYQSKDGKTTGRNTIGRLFSDGFTYWYSSTGPIMLILPDVAAAKARAKEKKEIVDGNVLDWTPPKGLKEILKEEWDLMAAKHRRATAS